MTSRGLTSRSRHEAQQPWVGATIWFPTGGTSAIGTHTFKDPYVIPIAAAHLGYEL